MLPNKYFGCSKSHTSAPNLIFGLFECVKCVYTEKYEEMQQTNPLKMLQKLNVDWWIFHILNDQHTGDVAEVAL